MIKISNHDLKFHFPTGLLEGGRGFCWTPSSKRLLKGHFFVPFPYCFDKLNRDVQWTKKSCIKLAGPWMTLYMLDFPRWVWMTTMGVKSDWRGWKTLSPRKPTSFPTLSSLTHKKMSKVGDDFAWWSKWSIGWYWGIKLLIYVWPVILTICVLTLFMYTIICEGTIL